MKKLFKIFLAAGICIMTASCGNNDDFTESIFDTTTPVVDPDASTAPFDQWLYENFVVPYNTEIQYKFNLTASNMNFQLAPADYKKSQLLAHYIKYLFYDVYNLYGGEDFMKQYGPRIFHFIGSSAYSPTTGTETQGYASAGVKITLINVNNMKFWKEDSPYTATDMESLNKDQFHVMHHEFSHILHQTKSYPVSFGQVTPGTYAPRDWQERDSVLSHSLGYLTQYGSSANYEDFVETLSCTITDTDVRWMNTIIDACANGGVKDGDKEQIYELIENLGIEDFDNPNKAWNNFKLYEEEEQDENTKLWSATGRKIPSFHVSDAKLNATTTVRYTSVAGTFTSFRNFLDNWVEVNNTEDTAGINAILKKIDIAKKWYTENWGLDMYVIREEVRKRQNNINTYTKDNVTIYDYQ